MENAHFLPYTYIIHRKWKLSAEKMTENAHFPHVPTNIIHRKGKLSVEEITENDHFPPDNPFKSKIKGKWFAQQKGKTKIFKCL